MAHHPIAAGKSSFDLVDVPLVFREIGLAMADSFFDVACGVGRYTLAAARAIKPGGIVYAADLWADGIASLRQSMEEQGIANIEPIHADVSQRLPLNDHSMDICFMATVLHDLVHDRTDQGTLAEIRRVTRPQGTLAVVEFRKTADGPGPPLSLRMAPEEVAALAAPFGFSRGKLFDTGPSTYCLTLTAR
ncbi:MAG: class I SAM-dependent methyltransferase [Thermodesulfobacteriota bacterium]